jgi:hypothetical protein
MSRPDIFTKLNSSKPIRNGSTAVSAPQQIVSFPDMRTTTDDTEDNINNDLRDRFILPVEGSSNSATGILSIDIVDKDNPQELLNPMLKELKMMNLQLALVTDTLITKQDVE